jgi:protein phosphatase
MIPKSGYRFSQKIMRQQAERELLSVPAAKVYYQPARPLAAPPEERTAQAVADDILDMEDVSGQRWIETELRGRIVVAQENAAAALEAMSRFAIAPQWLVYLPPTMSPCETSGREVGSSGRKRHSPIFASAA